MCLCKGERVFVRLCVWSWLLIAEAAITFPLYCCLRCNWKAPARTFNFRCRLAAGGGREREADELSCVCVLPPSHLGGGQEMAGVKVQHARHSFMHSFDSNRVEVGQRQLVIWLMRPRSAIDLHLAGSKAAAASYHAPCHMSLAPSSISLCLPRPAAASVEQQLLANWRHE